MLKEKIARMLHKPAPEGVSGLDMTKEDVTPKKRLLPFKKQKEKKFAVTAADIEAAEKAKERKNLLQVIAFGVVVVLILALLRTPMNKFIESTKEGGKLLPDEMIMTSFLGYDLDVATSILEKNEINVQVIYTYDKYSTDGTIIKTVPEDGYVIKKGSTVQLYVCDDGTPQHPLDYSSIQTQATPFNLDHIDVISFDIIDDKFSMIIQNNNNACITSIKYTIAFSNNIGEKIGGKTYQVNDIQILPGEKYILEETIKEQDTAYVSVVSFDPTVISVPNQPR